MRLKISTNKTEYMKLSAVEVRRRVQNITIGENNFESIKCYMYLGSVLNNNNNMF